MGKGIDRIFVLAGLVRRRAQVVVGEGVLRI